jgi:CubicO group peptidase (beta-lactamase class C family)
MNISRRAFTGGALGAALGTQLALPALAQNRRNEAAALAAIRAYGEAHRAYFGLPGMTLGVVTADGRRTVLNFGYANADARTPITAATLFQVGSISKLMIAAVLHQFAAEGRLRLTDRVSTLLPEVPLSRGNAIEIQHLLDHVAGLPSDTPMFAPGGLWTAYAPGQHWHYSNTGYEILGKLAEHVGGKPLRQLLRERIFAPLGMSRTRGAIIGADRPLYAQGYEAADPVAVFARGVPLAPAPWVDVTFGAGCVASTADDMMALLLSVAGAAQGRGGLGLSAQQARLFATHAVPTDTPGMTYGNGLMHVGQAGRAYLHHTGGMLSFSSSFHVDVASGVGAFASASIGAFAEYRPRLLTLFAVDALTSASAGRPLPAPMRLQPQLGNAASYVGRYAGPAGTFEVRLGNPLSIVASGTAAALEPEQDEVFRTAHPSFRQYSLMFDRSGGAVTAAYFGPNSYLREGAGGTLAPADPALARLAGRYIDDDPWFPPSPVVERGGKLWIGTETPMTKIGDNLWRVGKESWSPERASFADLLDGRPQTFVFSGVRFARHDI